MFGLEGAHNPIFFVSEMAGDRNLEILPSAADCTIAAKVTGRYQPITNDLQCAVR